MRIAIPREIHAGERRVAATPQTVLRLKKLGFDVAVEAGAGAAANYSDAAYTEAGAEIVDEPRRLWADAGIVLKVRPPEEHGGLGVHEADLLPERAALVSFVWPAQNKELVDRLAARRATVLAMDCIPRVTRAQKMDALSAMANIAGYRAVVEAAAHFPRFFAGQVTAAGKIEPARVMVIGAGVAGLAAIGAARGLGAIVRAFDTRPATRDQVRSMGAEFLEVNIPEDAEGGGGYAREMSPAFIAAEMALFAAQAMEVDIIITTALVPGKRAPQLITAGMVESMREGSVIVDLAAEQGGNCALTRPGEAVQFAGKTIIGYTDLPSRMAAQSSQLYSATLVNLLELAGGAAFTIDESDEVVRGVLVLRDGALMWPPPKPPPAPEGKVGAGGAEPSVGTLAGSVKPTEGPEKKEGAVAGAERGAGGERGAAGFVWMALAGLALLGIGLAAPETFLSHFTVFILACFVGWQVVWNVRPALHTPLMSVTNAISGIILIGGMLQLGHLGRSGGSMAAPTILGAIAVLIATINIAGGFLVTRRMLAMFRR